MEPVQAWAEDVLIPTYKIGAPDRNPMFLEKRVYQGSSGAVYPYPVIDKIFDEREEKAYTALFLENRYLRIMILPELGGRVQMALDKTNGYHFVYYNRVIKPALVGLTGPWISGGIEFNWPQHHRPSTFLPVDWRIEERADGAKTVWCSEVEAMFHTKGMHGFTLYPDRALLEINVQLYNRTAEPQTFLWWANPAVHVNQDYQSVFPPDVHAVMDHGKRDVSDFPIATGVYYKVNYAPGTDISRYKNIPVPTSFMAYHSDYDFIGCYDHGRRAGMLHVANHHVVPGKKQWTWGNGDFGVAWDRQLTDEDGPYIELMCGAYTDNQPDFSWLMPGEEKRFTQVFLPYKEIGPVSNASAEAAAHLEIADGGAELGVYLTRRRRVTLRLEIGGAIFWEATMDLSPERAWTGRVDLPDGLRSTDVTLRVLDGSEELLSFTPPGDQKPPVPSPASPARSPNEIETNEELFLNGLHLEQYRHATYPPEPYYEEALRRDPLDSRCNNALGLLLLRRGKFHDAEVHFRKAVEGLTRRNPNPYDGEPYYNLGLALRLQGRDREAFDAFYKAAWNAAWQDAAYFELGRLAARAGRWSEAIDLLERALRRNGLHHQARHLLIVLLRRLGRLAEAAGEAERALELDRMEPGALYELHRLRGGDDFERCTRAVPGTRLGLALDYIHAGLLDEALDLLGGLLDADPMAAYFAAWALSRAGRIEEARAQAHRAASLPPDYCFPNRIETVPALECAQSLDPTDPRAPYYLGNFWYSHKRYAEAIASWERAVSLDPAFPTAWRNLGLAYMNKRGDGTAARRALETALQCGPSDARVLFELDQLYKKMNRPPAERLEFLRPRFELVSQRDDLMVEWVTLLNLTGRHEDALQALGAHRFHPWEGGEGKSTGQYVLALVELARRAVQAGQFARALEWLDRTASYPSNLGEGKLPGAQENHIHYYRGLALAGLERPGESLAWLERASTGLDEPAPAVFYNDQPPEMIYYQGLARRALGREAEARQVFEKLVRYGRLHLDDEVRIDYFAVSLPDFLVFEDDLTLRNRVHCHFLIALGSWGLGDLPAARQHFQRALRLNPAHPGAVIHFRILEEA